MIILALNEQNLGIEFRYGTETRTVNQLVRHEIEHEGQTWYRNAREDVEVEVRTTTCNIYDIKDANSRENPLVASATIACDSREQFVKEFGRRQSLVKALLSFYGVERERSAEIINDYFKNGDNPSEFFKRLNWVDNRIREAFYRFDQYREEQRENAYIQLDIEHAHRLLENLEETPALS